ncbi:helix-turn-helix transcriptional regulator [Sorangium sp. So ce1153]|uniref:helix-turn-helix transcriptional regulator n=1 Tax=Sorangium sp. So ce1153 TaxID=3133333 RepID=UPI003F5DCBA6
MVSLDELKSASSIEELLAEPAGKYFVDPTFVFWYPERTFHGFSLWGRPSADDVERLNRLNDAVLAPQDGRHVSLVDLRGLEGADPRAFASMAAYLSARWQPFRERVIRQALVRPSGFAGAVVSGFYEVLKPSFPVAVFDGVGEALAWLGRGDREALVERLIGLRDQAGGAAGVLGSLRRLLCASPCRPALAEAARALHLSERSLQRHLRRAGTTFQAEVNAARVRVAQGRMLAGDDSLTAIAIDVGCASAQHFSAMFRKATGQSPSEWRARARGARRESAPGRAMQGPPPHGKRREGGAARDHEGFALSRAG